MRKLAYGTGIVILIMLAGGIVLAQAGPEVLARLGVDKVSAGSSVLSALTSGYIYDSAAFTAFKALPASGRAEIVRTGLAWAKDYSGSAEFKAAYAKLRESRKPKPPEPVPSAEETLAKMKADIEKGIENLRQVQATANAEMKKSLEDTVKQMRAQLEQMDKNPQMKENLRLGAEMERKSKQEDYETRMKAWNEDLPEEPKTLIAKRVRQFLETSADVDFAAELGKT